LVPLDNLPKEGMRLPNFVLEHEVSEAGLTVFLAAVVIPGEQSVFDKRMEGFIADDAKRVKPIDVGAVEEQKRPTFAALFDIYAMGAWGAVVVQFLQQTFVGEGKSHEFAHIGCDRFSEFVGKTNFI